MSPEDEAFFRVESHELRLGILKALLDGPALTTELSARLGEDRYNLYRHLDVLEAEGFVGVERLGKKMKRYYLKEEREADVRKLLGMPQRGREERIEGSRIRYEDRETPMMLNALTTNLTGMEQRPAERPTEIDVIDLRNRQQPARYVLDILAKHDLVDSGRFEDIDHIIIVGRRRRGR